MDSFLWDSSSILYLYSIPEDNYYILFQWFHFDIQQLYSERQESKDSNIKPVKEVNPYFIRPTLRWAASHLSLMHNFLYIRMSEPGAAKARDKSHPKQRVNDAHPSGSSVLTVRLEPPLVVHKPVTISSDSHYTVWYYQLN